MPCPFPFLPEVRTSDADVDHLPGKGFILFPLSGYEEIGVYRELGQGLSQRIILGQRKEERSQAPISTGKEGLKISPFRKV